MTLSHELADFAGGVSFRDLPAEVTTSIRERILDIVGLALASRPLETSEMAAAMARAWGGSSESQVIGFKDRVPAAAAGFVNGVLAHSLDFDDTHLPSVLHPSASVIPTALAVGEAVGASMHSVVAAAAAGYEVCIRTGMAGYDREMGNSVFFEKGWHATSICGTLASAVVAAKLYGLDAAGIGHAIGIAASMGSGIIEANRSGGSVKRLHCGWATHAGVIAAQCAREGITGPPSVLEGRFGFYQAYCDGFLVAEEITTGLGEDWSIPEIFYKPYPANHFTHAGIDAALELRNLVSIDDIEALDLRVATPTLRTIAEPRQEKIHPRSGYHAQFSGPFTIAAALLGGGGLGLWLDDFSDENAQDPRYLALAAKVECGSDPECDAIFPNQFPAILRARMYGGEELEIKVLTNRGGPGNPLSVEELETKFYANAGRCVDDRVAEAVAKAVLDPSDRPVGSLLEAVEVQPSAVAG